MKNVRINLIKRNEVRYQGVVNPKFLAFALSGAIAAALLLVVVVRSVQFTYRKSIVKGAQQHWARIEPRYESAKKVSLAIKRQTKILEELRSRRDNVTTWDEFLLMLQSTVPENIQFTRLSLYSSIVKGEDALSKFSVTGVSRGEAAEGSVFLWRELLLRSDIYLEHYDSLELGYLRQSGRGDDVAQRSFEFEGGRVGDGSSGEKGGRK